MPLRPAVEHLAEELAEPVGAGLVDHERVDLRAGPQLDRADPDDGLGPSTGAQAQITAREAGSNASSRATSTSEAAIPRPASRSRTAGASLRRARRSRTGGPPGSAWVRAKGEGIAL